MVSIKYHPKNPFNRTMQVIIKKFIVSQFIAAIAVGCYGPKKSIKIINAKDLYKKGSLISDNKFKRFKFIITY